MSYCKIPITTSPNATYRFRISLKGNEVNQDIIIKLRYLDLYEVWTMDVYKDSLGDLVLCGAPLVCGTNILGQYEHLDIGEAYIVQAKADDLMHPDNRTLGNDFVLVWGDAS